MTTQSIKKIARAMVAALLVTQIPAAPAAASQSKRPMTVEDMWAVKRIGSPALSPDGKWVAIDLTAYDMSENTSSSDLWLLSTSGEPARQLTAHAARDGGPVWSPDGAWIAFVSRREGDTQNQIYVISPAGGEARRVTAIPTGASSPRWFPDSKRIAFISSIWPELKTDDEQAKRLKERQDSKVKAYVIDTTNYRYWDHWIADGRVPHLFAVDVETGRHRDLLAGTGLSLPRFEPSAGHYDISPDGREVAVTTDLTKDPGFQPNADIVTVQVEGGKWTNITSANPANDTGPRYSPDGKWIAYLKQTIPHFYADRQQIVIHDRSNGAKRALTESWDRSADSTIWSPDSRRIYFGAEDKARQPIWKLELAGRDPSPVIQGGTNSNIAVSRDGRTIVYLRTEMGLPTALFAASSSGAEVRKLDRFNDELAGKWQFGEVKDVTYKGWGGEPVQMWVVYPPNFDRSKKWPLLQIVHGGPHGAWLDQYHPRWNLHLFASRGYVVAAVNFHGSTGWGQAFTDSITAQYGPKEFEDVEKGTDYLIGEGYIDPDRLAAAGGSYGGYMVAWMNGHTNRYKAYVCHAGVYNWISQMASDTVRGRDRALGGFPWQNPQKALEQSAHSYAKNFKTPTLVVHGELDYRVPVTQGFEYYLTLRMLEVPSRLIYFPDENHWVLKPQNSRLWYKEFFDWIEKFLAVRQ
jgi:dipeptidyl aminopeptidase/acylaminoacyl peptidase